MTIEASEQDLVYRIEGLKRDVVNSGRRMRLWLALSAVLLVLLLVSMITYHFYNVMQYAEMDKVRVYLDPSQSSLVTEYAFAGEGKIELRYLHYDKVRTIALHSVKDKLREPDKFSYDISGGQKPVLEVLYRDGWSLKKVVD